MQPSPTQKYEFVEGDEKIIAPDIVVKRITAAREEQGE